MLGWLIVAPLRLAINLFRLAWYAVRRFFWGLGSRKRPRVVVFRLGGDLLWRPPPRAWIRFRRDPPSLEDIRNELERIEMDGGVHLVIFHFDGLTCSLTRLLALADMIEKFRERGMNMAGYLIGGGLKDYLAAASTGSVWAYPVGSLHLPGISAGQMYLRHLLDRLGVGVDVVTAGEYKSAFEFLSRAGMSQPARQALQELVDGLAEEVTQRIARYRGLSQEEARALVSAGPTPMTVALEKKWIDSLAREDGIRAALDKDKPDQVAMIPAGARCGLKPVFDWIPLVNPRSFIAYCKFEGNIWRAGAGFRGPATGGESGRYCAIFRAMAEADSVKAACIHIESPGGDVVASDLLWAELAGLARKKPVVVYMGHVAASGGYYMACPAHVIVASPACITGSIGVISGRADLSAVLDKLGVNYETVDAAGQSDPENPWKPMSGEQRARLRKDIQDIYSQFLDRVAEGRKMDKARADELGRGRVWLGKQAKELGLVDFLGSLDDALELTHEKGGVPKSPWRMLDFTPREPANFQRMLLRGGGNMGGPPGGELGLLRRLVRGEALLWSPFDVDIPGGRR
ncbi:MAG: Protease 4 [Myxococcota bacterium]|nr:Protease 4 [Myxococcota bacterium]